MHLRNLHITLFVGLAGAALPAPVPIPSGALQGDKN
jgi:hypothetical protein